MELTFLGTGPAWALPEMGCRCRVCQTMRALGEERKRTCMLLRARETFLLDCGPDIRRQLSGELDQPPDFILITHAHADHYLGLDELETFRRLHRPQHWRPIPTYATPESWARIERVFGYLVGRLIEKRLAEPGRPLGGIETTIIPFTTYHGDSAKGSVGYLIQNQEASVLYTSDFQDLPEDPPLQGPPHILIIQSHWLHEPEVNRPSHMSFQRAIQFIRRWAPRSTYLVHLSEEYPVEGDPFDKGLKTTPPKDPLIDPQSGRPYPQPLCHEDWQKTVSSIAGHKGLPGEIWVAKDGMKVKVV